MKKIFAVILSLVLIMALAACGGQTAGSAQQGSSAVQSGAASADPQTPAGTDNPASSDVPVETVPPVSSDVPVETVPPVTPGGDVSAPSSDGSNGSTGIEKIVIDEAVKPENFKLTDSGEEYGGYYETYTMEDIAYRDVLDYKNKLVEKGFCILSYSMGSEIEADSLAYEIKYKFQYSGTESIISFTELERRAEQGLEDPGVLTVKVRARDLSGYHNLPEFSEGDWNIFDNGKVIMCELGSYVNCSKEERKTTAKSYVETLKGNGYSLNVEEYPDGKELSYTSSQVPLYNFYAEADNGGSVKVYVYEDLAFPYSQAGVDEWAGIEITFKKAK